MYVCIPYLALHTSGASAALGVGLAQPSPNKDPLNGKMGRGARRKLSRTGLALPAELLHKRACKFDLCSGHRLPYAAPCLLGFSCSQTRALSPGATSRSALSEGLLRSCAGDPACHPVQRQGMLTKGKHKPQQSLARQNNSTAPGRLIERLS